MVVGLLLDVEEQREINYISKIWLVGNRARSLGSKSNLKEK